MSALDETLAGAFARASLADVQLVDRRPLTNCYIGTHIDTGTEVFIKALHSESSDIQRNFMREIGILQTLSGRPGFPVLRSFVSTPEIKFHACEHLTAPRFDQLARDSSLSLDDIIRFASALAAWLQRLHALGYVHRDLSPDHVFAGDPITAVDFGLAKRLDGLRAEDRGRCLGYDVQAFGLILWEMICGHPIFQYRSPMLVLEIPPQLRVIHSLQLPAPLAHTLVGCLAARSEMTPQGTGLLGFHSADEVVAGLRTSG